MYTLHEQNACICATFTLNTARNIHFANSYLMYIIYTNVTKDILCRMSARTKGAEGVLTGTAGAPNELHEDIRIIFCPT